jgi:hypothetical protein
MAHRPSLRALRRLARVGDRRHRRRPFEVRSAFSNVSRLSLLLKMGLRGNTGKVYEWLGATEPSNLNP